MVKIGLKGKSHKKKEAQIAQWCHDNGIGA